MIFQATLTKPPTDDDFEVEGLLGLPAAGGGGKKRGSADTTATGLATNLPFYVQVFHGKKDLDWRPKVSDTSRFLKAFNHGLPNWYPDPVSEKAIRNKLLL